MSQPPNTRSSSEASGTKSWIFGTRRSVRFPNRIVPSWVKDPTGWAIFFLIASTPAINVVLTAPSPGISTPNFPDGPSILTPFCTIQTSLKTVSQHDELEAPQVTQLHEYLPPHGQSGRAAALERRWSSWKQPKIFVAVAVAHVQCGAWVDQVGKQQVHSPAVLRLHPRQGRVPIHGRIVQNRAEGECAGELVVQLLTQDAVRKDPLRGVSRQQRRARRRSQAFVEERVVEAQRAHGPECEPDRPILRIGEIRRQPFGRFVVHRCADPDLGGPGEPLQPFALESRARPVRVER